MYRDQPSRDSTSPRISASSFCSWYGCMLLTCTSDSPSHILDIALDIRSRFCIICASRGSPITCHRAKLMASSRVLTIKGRASAARSILSRCAYKSNTSLTISAMPRMIPGMVTSNNETVSVISSKIRPSMLSARTSSPNTCSYRRSTAPISENNTRSITRRRTMSCDSRLLRFRKTS